MIQVILRGGLGNQMFEYSVGLALARKYKTDLVLDTTYLRDRFPRPNMTYRNYDLHTFNIAPKFTMLSRISNKLPIPGVWLGCDLGLVAARDVLGIRRLVREKNEAKFDPAVLESGDGSCLWGFWQSPRYFADIEEEIRKIFQFRNALPREAVQMAKKIGNANSISLSVRRGDYLRAGNAQIYGETDVRYYEDAIKYMASRIPSPHFFIFSDDIDWCEEYIKPAFPTTYVSRELPGLSWDFTMELSLRCRHQIIANSTFWWWAAWLNDNPEKIVIAPKRWHVGSGPVEEDIIPDGWIKL